jgi:Domain of unknown function DUF29
MSHMDYDIDFYAWTQAQAAALRAKDVAALDLDNLAEEIDSLGKSDRRALRSHLKVLTQHLLKLRYQPQERERRGPGWRISARNARQEIALILDDSPSLQRQLPRLLASAYPHACQDAADETGLPLATFPEPCPWSLEQLQDPGFWPEG